MTRAQSDPKNPVQNVTSANPSKFDHPFNQPDAKLTPEQRTAIENADHSNPARPPSAAPDQKKSAINPDPEKPVLPIVPDSRQVPPGITLSTPEKTVQPEGEKPASVTDYRSIKGPNTQPPGVAPVKDGESPKK